MLRVRVRVRLRVGVRVRRRGRGLGHQPVVADEHRRAWIRRVAASSTCGCSLEYKGLQPRVHGVAASST